MPLWEKTEAEAIATDLLQFTVWQSEGLNTVEIAERMHITVGLARRYERAIAALMVAVTTAPDEVHQLRTELRSAADAKNPREALAKIWARVNRTAPDATEAVPDPKKGIHS